MNNKIMLQECRVGNLIKIMDAKTKVLFWNSETEEKIFEGYFYQLYDNEEMIKALGDLYIYDMLVDYDGLRVACYDKWKTNK